ncbi:META domain-containing protein [Tabrizicola sp. YIM 78059]|uniref:META domain-containing protein n=1 Tax=Tabrizicola sp. YIM 78059 TaxID=2529861 RepID=UPI00145A72E4|nr:META domain-containing protein [Tabrizicola sp. YIM 78059]
MRQMLPALALLALVAGPLAAAPCETADGPEGEGASVLVARVANLVWTLKTIDAEPIPDMADVWLTVTPDGAVSGRAGCNRYAGTAELDAGKVVFGPLAVTRMACDAATMELERAYLKALTEVRGFAVGPDDGLRLSREDGSTVLCFGGGD